MAKSGSHTSNKHNFRRFTILLLSVIEQPERGQMLYDTHIDSGYDHGLVYYVSFSSYCNLWGATR